MNTLLIRLAGPMQSWGTQSRFTYRDTGLEPSKSGVVGLLCAAIGRPRHETVDDLAALRMGVRVEREGLLRVDYHTAGGTNRRNEKYGVHKANGGTPDTLQSWRHFLADAAFLVGLESHDEVLLRHLDHALAEPVWPLSLGRKSFVPSHPVRLSDGLQLGITLETALCRYPWSAGETQRSRRERPERLRLVLESALGEGGETRRDQPVGTAYLERRFALRQVTTSFMNLAPEVSTGEK